MLDDFETERQAHRARKRSGRRQAVRSAPAHTHHSLYPTRLRIRLKPLARPLEATTSTWWRLLALVGGGLSDMRE
jgi:hypothetical protein